MLDRLEYLKHLQSGFADFSMSQAEKLKTSSKSHSRMRRTLTQGAPEIERMVENQRDVMQKSGTASRQLKKFDRFVERNEKFRVGEAGATAARAATTAHASERGHFTYDRLDISKRHSRCEPLMAVAGMKRYSSPALVPSECANRGDDRAHLDRDNHKDAGKCQRGDSDTEIGKRDEAEYGRDSGHSEPDRLLDNTGKQDEVTDHPGTETTKEVSQEGETKSGSLD
jgi:hypothetical protein